MKRVRTVHDYMQWRGDLTLEQDPFNEVDSVILGMVSFLDFSGIVPAPGEAGTVAFRHAVDEFDAIPGKDRHFGVIIPDVAHPFFAALLHAVPGMPMPGCSPLRIRWTNPGRCSLPL